MTMWISQALGALLGRSQEAHPPPDLNRRMPLDCNPTDAHLSGACSQPDRSLPERHPLPTRRSACVPSICPVPPIGPPPGSRPAVCPPAQPPAGLRAWPPPTACLPPVGLLSAVWPLLVRRLSRCRPPPAPHLLICPPPPAHLPSVAARLPPVCRLFGPPSAFQPPSVRRPFARRLSAACPPPGRRPSAAGPPARQPARPPPVRRPAVRQPPGVAGKMFLLTSAQSGVESTSA